MPVCVKGGGPDGAQEKIEELTVRILLGLNKQKQSKVRSGRARPIPSALASARTQASLARAASRARAASLTISPPLPPPPGLTFFLYNLSPLFSNKCLTSLD